jgi:beta-lactamase class C
MARYHIPGMAVGIVEDGHVTTAYFGVATAATGAPITSQTLFEVGSITKTVTATLAAYAQATGRLSLSDSASKHFAPLRGSAMDQVSLLNLGTHTAGGFPLQMPEGITTTPQLIAYFRNWKPQHPPGTSRTYANPGIGLLGLIAAASLGRDFDSLIQGNLFRALGMRHSFLHVPSAQLKDYAEGTTQEGRPIRLSRGILASETYGLRTTADDLLLFLQANMRTRVVDQTWQNALLATHTGYFRIGPFTQDLVWEQYTLPVSRKDLLEGNSDRIIHDENPATRLDPPTPPQGDVLIDKTGSTNGFGAYVAFIPARHAGIVLLANRSYPIAARVTAAYAILAKLGLIASPPGTDAALPEARSRPPEPDRPAPAPRGSAAEMHRGPAPSKAPGTATAPSP